MTSLVYFALKASVAFFALLFQFVLVDVYGPKFAGEVNRLQIWAFFLSVAVLPGLEFSILRRLPKLRREHGLEYTEFMKAFRLLQILSTIIILIALVVATMLFFEAAQIFTVGAILTYLYVSARLLPIIYRIEGRFLRSVFSEQGVLFFIGTFVVLILPTEEAWILWWWICCSTLVFSFALLIPGGYPKLSVQLESIKIVGQGVRQDYGLAVSLTAIANFSILWLPATLGTFVLSSEDLATSVAMLRIIGLLLFVESVMSSYHLPHISAAVGWISRKQAIHRFRLACTVGTAAMATGVIAVISLVDPFDFKGSYYFILGVFLFVQIFICVWGSPFSVAVVLSSSRRIRGMSLTVIFLSLINSAIFLCFPSWQLIVLGFTVLQFGRAAIGARTLVLESAK